MAVALVAVLMTGLCLTACGGDNSVKISVAKFDDSGIDMIWLWYTDYSVYQRYADGKDGEEAANAVRQNAAMDMGYSSIYQYRVFDDDGGIRYNNYEKSKLDKGSYFLILSFTLTGSYNIGNLHVEVNGKTYPVFEVDLAAGWYSSHLAVITEEINASTQIKLVGKTAKAA